MDEGSVVGPTQEPTFSATQGGSVVGYLPAGIVIWGGLGMLLDRWLGTEFLTPVGLVIGFVLAMYLVFLFFVRGPVTTSDQQPMGMGADRSKEEGIG
jgi:ATP synthase protein I